MSAAPNHDFDDDLDFEPKNGVSGRLPEGERVLWQGAPEWRALSLSAFHARKVAVYFGLLVLWAVANGLANGAAPAAIALSAGWLVAIGAAAAGTLAALAFAYARTTVYTLTTRRLVIRSGIALPVTFNLPLTQVDSAALALGKNGIGSISFTVVKPNRVALLVIWPHARPWAFTDPQPTLRCIADAAGIARLATEALRRETGAAGVALGSAQASSPVLVPAAAAAGMAA